MDNKSSKIRKTIRSVNEDSARLAKKPSPDPNSPIGPTDPKTISKAVGGPSAKLPPKRPDSESNLSRKQMMRRRKNQGKKKRFQEPVPEAVEEDDDNPGLLDEASGAETPEPETTQSIESILESPTTSDPTPEVPTSPPAVEPSDLVPELPDNQPVAHFIEAEALPSAPVPFRWNIDAPEFTPAARLEPSDYSVLFIDTTEANSLPAEGPSAQTESPLYPRLYFNIQPPMQMTTPHIPDGHMWEEQFEMTQSGIIRRISTVTPCTTYAPPWIRRPERPVAPLPVVQHTTEAPEVSPTSALSAVPDAESTPPADSAVPPVAPSEPARMKTPRADKAGFHRFGHYYYHGLGPQPKPLRVRIESPYASSASVEPPQNEPELVREPPVTAIPSSAGADPDVRPAPSSAKRKQRRDLFKQDPRKAVDAFHTRLTPRTTFRRKPPIITPSDEPPTEVPMESSESTEEEAPVSDSAESSESTDDDEPVQQDTPDKESHTIPAWAKPSFNAAKSGCIAVAGQVRRLGNWIADLGKACLRPKVDDDE